jgi:hypothetical protein
MASDVKNGQMSYKVGAKFFIKKRGEGHCRRGKERKSPTLIRGTD